MNTANRTHITIINQGIDYIVDHLFEKITVEMIADHCCFTRHYYNRLFKSVTGENVYHFIRRVRIEMAAFKLIKFPHLSITRIASELGYSSSNFAVMFKAYYGISPSQFRSNPSLPPESGSASILKRIKELQENKPERLLQQMDQRISFEETPDINVVYRRFVGNYHNLASVWESFCMEMERLFPDSPIEYFGISYDDPLIVGQDKCLYDLCAVVPEPAKVNDANRRTIPGGSYLCYHFNDHVGELNRLYNDLFAVWMPHRGHIMDQGICFERYSDATPDGHLVMDLCVPILPGNRAQIQK
jgi:AraC family transcriptional regulator